MMEKQNSWVKKVFFGYYVLAILLGFYQAFIRLIYPIPTLIENMTKTPHWTEYFIIPVFFIMVILSIVIIILTFKKRLLKLNLIYPIYWLGLWFFTLIINSFILLNYPLVTASSILSNISQFYTLFYIFDMIFPLYMINKLRNKF